MMNDVPTTEFGADLAGSGTQDAPMRPPQTHGRFHLWRAKLRWLRLVWPRRKANVSQLQACEMSLHTNSGHGEMTATPLSTPDFPSSPSRERGEPNDQDYLREDDGRRTTYINIVARDSSRQHNGNITNGHTTFNRNTTFNVYGPSHFYNP
jgi:hypothetical protein